MNPTYLRTVARTLPMRLALIECDVRFVVLPAQSLSEIINGSDMVRLIILLQILIDGIDKFSNPLSNPLPHDLFLLVAH